MTELTLAAPSQSLWDALVGYIARTLGLTTRPSLPVPEEVTPWLAIGRRVLGATELRDVERRLDDAIVRFQEAMQTGQLRAPISLLNDVEQLLSEGPLPEDPPEDGPVRAALGVAVGRKLGRALRLVWEQLSVLLTVLKDPDLERRARSMAWLSLDPWALHEGKVVPLAVMHSVSANARGVAALLALLAACLDERRPEPWLVNALADRAIECLAQGLRLHASLPSSAVSTSLVPLSERFDLDLLQAEAEAADAAIVAELTMQVLSGAPQVLDEDE